MNFSRLFPEQIDNDYQGHPIAKWVFVLLTIITVGRSLIHMFASDGGAQSIATIALDSFTPGGADTVITVFALWGLSQLIIGLLYVVVLWRYQSFIPLMYVSMVFEYSMRIGIGLYSPGIETTGVAPGGVFQLALVPIALVMLVLSLWNTKADETNRIK